MKVPGAIWSLVPALAVGVLLAVQVAPLVVVVAWAATVCEVIGLACVFTDIHRTRRDILEFLRAAPGTNTVIIRDRIRFTDSIVPAGQRTIEQRVESLEGQIEELRQEMVRESDYLEEVFKEDIRELRGVLTGEQGQQWEKLVRLLKGQMLAAADLRLVGIAFVFAGVLLGAVATTMSATAR